MWISSFPNTIHPRDYFSKLSQHSLFLSLAPTTNGFYLNLCVVFFSQLEHRLHKGTWYVTDAQYILVELDYELDCRLFFFLFLHQQNKNVAPSELPYNLTTPLKAEHSPILWPMDSTGMYVYTWKNIYVGSPKDWPKEVLLCSSQNPETTRESFHKRTGNLWNIYTAMRMNKLQPHTTMHHNSMPSKRSQTHQKIHPYDSIYKSMKTGQN